MYISGMYLAQYNVRIDTCASPSSHLLARHSAEVEDLSALHAARHSSECLPQHDARIDTCAMRAI